MKKGLYFCVFMVLIIAVIGTYKVQSKLTYFEYQYVNEIGNDSLEIYESEEIEQFFIAPYDYVRGFSVKVKAIS